MFRLIIYLTCVVLCRAEIDYYKRHQDCTNSMEEVEAPEGLESGWYSPFNGKQYRLVEVRRDYGHSRVECRNQGGEMVTQGMHADLEYSQLISCVLGITKHKNAWIGLQDLEKLGTNRWYWIDGHEDLPPPETIGWDENQPQQGLHYNCALITENALGEYRFKNGYCYDKNYSICEKKL